MKEIGVITLFLAGFLMATGEASARCGNGFDWLRQELFGVSETGTVMDYMSADHDSAVEFITNFCCGFSCLPTIMYRCGFRMPESHDKITDCFHRVVRRVEPWEKLDRIREYCIARLAAPIPFQNVTKSDCKKRGGNWLQRKRVDLQWRNK